MTDDSISLRRRLRRRFYWLLALGGLQVADHFPLRMGRSLGVSLAKLAYRIRRSERRRAMVNLETAFPELEAGQRQKILDASAVALGRNFFDGLAARRILEQPGSVVADSGGDEQDQPLLRVMRELLAKDRGLFLLTGHLGCWELLGGWLARQAQDNGLGKLAVVTGTVHNPPVNRLLQDRRRRLGLEVLPREDGARPLLEHLKSGGAAAVLLDQNTHARNLDVPFFNRSAPTPVGLALIALKHRVPVLPVAIRWDQNQRCHRVVHLPYLDPGRWRQGSGEVTESQVRAFLVDCNLQLEELIRRNPREWVWFHRRWEKATEISAEARG